MKRILLNIGAALFLLALSQSIQAQTAESTPSGKSKTFAIPPDINGLKTMIAPPAKTKPVKAAIFNGKGASIDGIENV